MLVRELGVHPVALARPRASGTSGALVGGGLGEGEDSERVHPHPGVVHFELAVARVDHVEDAIDRQRGLGDVGRHDHLARAALCLVEDLGLWGVGGGGFGGMVG